MSTTTNRQGTPFDQAMARPPQPDTSKPPATFADLLARPVKGRCGCGAPLSTRLTLAARKLGAGPGGGKALGVHKIERCEACAVMVFADLMERES